MKRFLMIGGLLVLLGAGCFPSSSAVVEPSTGTVPSETASETQDVPSASPTVSQPADTEETETLFLDLPLNMEMAAGNFFFDPSEVTVAAGQEVAIAFTNTEGSHTFVIDEISLHETIISGSTITFKAPTVPGRYVYYCDIGAHRKLGMQGALIVK